jgi:hypothetical protein
LQGTTGIQIPAELMAHIVNPLAFNVVVTIVIGQLAVSMPVHVVTGAEQNVEVSVGIYIPMRGNFN